MKILQTNGHRWSNEEIKKLMLLWNQDESLIEISKELAMTQHAVAKMVTRLRSEGIPLKRRIRGMKAGSSTKPWTQSEIEYLSRRRMQGMPSEQIANEMGRTYCAINAMIQKLRSEQVSLPIFGNGTRRAWDSSLLKAALVSEFAEQTT